MYHRLEKTHSTNGGRKEDSIKFSRRRAASTQTDPSWYQITEESPWRSKVPGIAPLLTTQAKHTQLQVRPFNTQTSYINKPNSNKSRNKLSRHGTTSRKSLNTRNTHSSLNWSPKTREASPSKTPTCQSGAETWLSRPQKGAWSSPQIWRSAEPDKTEECRKDPTKMMLFSSSWTSTLLEAISRIHSTLLIQLCRVL